MSASPKRRELVRQYKENGPAAGVYAIRNLVSGRVLLGASMNAQGTLHRHRFELQLQSHRNAALQADWLALGADAFRFDVVDVLKKKDDPAFDAPAELEALLALWRAELDPVAAGYEGGAR